MQELWMQLAVMQAQPKQMTHRQLNLPCLHAGVMDATGCNVICSNVLAALLMSIPSKHWLHAGIVGAAMSTTQTGNAHAAWLKTLSYPHFALSACRNHRCNRLHPL